MAAMGLPKISPKDGAPAMVTYFPQELRYKA